MSYMVEVGGQYLQRGVYLRESGKYGIGVEKARTFHSLADAEWVAGQLNQDHPQLLFWAAEHTNN